MFLQITDTIKINSLDVNYIIENTNSNTAVIFTKEESHNVDTKKWTEIKKEIQKDTYFVEVPKFGFIHGYNIKWYEYNGSIQYYKICFDETRPDYVELTKDKISGLNEQLSQKLEAMTFKKS